MTEIKMMSLGRNVLKVVSYSVVIPLRPLQRGTLTVAVSLWLGAWYLRIQVVRKYSYKAISPIQAGSQKSSRTLSGGTGEDSTVCV